MSYLTEYIYIALSDLVFLIIIFIFFLKWKSRGAKAWVGRGTQKHFFWPKGTDIIFRDKDFCMFCSILIMTSYIANDLQWA